MEEIKYTPISGLSILRGFDSYMITAPYKCIGRCRIWSEWGESNFCKPQIQLRAEHNQKQHNI